MNNGNFLITVIGQLFLASLVLLSCSDKGQNPENGPPTITSASSASALVDQEFSYAAAATDPDGTTPDIHFENFANWLDTAGLVISGTPSADTPDTSFDVIAADSSAADTLHVTIDVVAELPPVSYTNDIRPILYANCINCHIGGIQGGLRMDNYTLLMAGGNSGPVIIPGDAENSLLVERIEGRVAPRMPLDRPPLSQQNIDLIRTWIDDGANDN